VKKTVVVILLFCYYHSLFAQTNPGSYRETCSLHISLLTCTPGQELYSTFGHSALRVTDSSDGSDIIYNYGTFDFDDPAFYSKFIRGNLLYFVSVDKLENFLKEYKYEQRGITEQVLNLTCAEKEKLYSALRENAKEENKYYKYDFVYDNCTTRLRDIVFENATGRVNTKDIRPAGGVTFRNLIHEYLDKSYQYWSKLGIDILLGSPIDKKISNSEAMFLPDYLLKGFDSAAINGKPLVSGKTEILKPTLRPNKRPLLSPFAIFTILFLLIAVLSFFKKAARFFSVFDFIFFFFSGVLGILILFMWFGTDHPECRNNFNLFWALPTHLLIVFVALKKLWVKYYFRIIFWISVAVLLSWFFLPQQMNNALLPVMGLMIVRSFFLSKQTATETQKH